MNVWPQCSVLALLVVGCSASTAEIHDDQEALRRDAASDAAPRDTGNAPDAGDPGANADGASSASVFVDPRDGQAYPLFAVGTQRWFARNLNFDLAGSSYCYGDDPSQCDLDGRLYSWSVARTACPPGAHLGSDAEWKTMERALGMAQGDLDLEGYSTVRGTNEGTTLKDAAGFGAHMAGYRTGTDYDALGDRTYFWTSSTRSGEVWRRRVADAEPTVFRFTNPPSTFAISIRCVVD